MKKNLVECKVVKGKINSSFDVNIAFLKGRDIGVANKEKDGYER